MRNRVRKALKKASKKGLNVTRNKALSIMLIVLMLVSQVQLLFIFMPITAAAEDIPGGQAYDKDYYEKLKRDDLSDGYYSNHNFAEKFKVAPGPYYSNSANGYIGNCITSNSRYAKNIEFYAQYDFDETGLIALNAKKGNLEIGLVLYSKNTKVSRGILDIFIEPDYFESHAYLYGYKSNGQSYLIKEYFWGKTEASTKGAGDSNEIAWMSIKEGTVGLGLKLTSTGPEGSGHFTPSTRFENPQIYMRDVGGPMILAANGNGNIKAGENAEITLEYDEDIYILDGKSIPDINAQGVIQGESSKTKTMTFKYIEKPSSNKLLFRSAVPANEINELDLYSFNIKQSDLAAISDCLADEYGNSPKESSRAVVVSNLKVDNVPPEIKKVFAVTKSKNTQGNNKYAAGDTILFKVQFSETVEMTDNINKSTLTLNNGKTIPLTLDTTGDTSGDTNRERTILNYTYTVNENDENTSRLDIADLGDSEIKLTYSGDIKDICGNVLHDTAVVKEGSNFIAGMFYVDTVAPSITIVNRTEDFSDSTLKRRYAIFQVKATDANKLDLYYLTANGSYEMAISQSLIDEGELAGDSYPFTKSEGAKGPGEVLHYLYIKGLSEGEMSLTFSMTDAAGNHKEKTESLFFDTRAPVVDIETICENAADDAVTMSNRITARDRLDPESPESLEGIGVDWDTVMYKWEAGTDNSSDYKFDNDGVWQTPSSYENSVFTLPAQTIAKNTIFDKTLYVKAEDKYGNRTEISRRLYADRNINILISEPENKGEITGDFNIILDGSTNRDIRIAWSGSDTYPLDEEFMAVFEAVYMAPDVNLGSLEMQGNYEYYRRKWNIPFTGDFKLYAEWYDTDSLLWRPYGDPALYRFSNSYPSIDPLEFIWGSDYFEYHKGKILPVFHVIQKEAHIYDGFVSSKSFPLDAKNGTAKLIDANDKEIASIPMPSGSDFIFDLNQYFDIPAPGRYKLRLDTVTYGGKRNSYYTEIEFVLDPLAPVIENLPAGEDGVLEPVNFEPDQLKLDGYKYMYDDEEVRLPYYLYWMKVMDEPYIDISSLEDTNPLKYNLDRSVHLYYSVDAVSFDVVKDRTEEEDWDPSAGLERYYLDVGGAADADFYQGGYGTKMPSVDTLYYIEALDGKGDNSDEDCHMILPDEWPDGIDDGKYRYIPVYIPVNLDKLDGQMKLNYVIVDSVGNFREGELLFRCDINPPAVDLSYSSYEETSTGPITVTIANIHDAYTPSEKLKWCFPYESGVGSGANVWNTLGDYRAFNLALNRENCMNSPILAFKDESGNTNAINIKPQWFITETPDLAVDFIDPDDADIIGYSLDLDWQTNGNPIPFVKDSIKVADSYVTFDVESNDLGEKHPIYIAFSDETPWNTGGAGDGETPETWILLDDGIDFPWLKVTALPENERYSAYRVKVLPRPSIANEGINQLFIMTHDRLGNENVIGTLNKNKMVEMRDSIILLNTGDKENGIAGAKLTENRLSTGEVQSVTAEITFGAGVYASIKDINNIKLPRNIESYSRTYSFTFTENKEHVIYYADIYGQVYSEKLPISGITEGLFPDIATNPSSPTNSGSATLVIDAAGIDGMSFKGVEISGAAIIPDGTIGENSGGETVYKKLTCTVTQNTTINYTVIRNSTEYSGSYELKLFDREAPSATLQYSFLDDVVIDEATRKQKTSGRVVAALTDIDDNFGCDGIEVYTSTGDSLVDVTNSPNYIFAENGSIDFILRDGAGNERTIKAEVSCIDKSLTVETGQPLGFLASFYSQSGGSLTYLGESSMLDENKYVIAPYAHVRENVIVKILPVSQKEVTASINNPLPGGEIEPLDGKNLQYRFLNGEAELSLTLKEDPGSGDSDEITIKIKANIDREAPRGYVSYETQADDSIHAILIVSDNITAFENLLFDDDDVLPKKEDGSRYKVFAENGDYTFTVRDAAGNASKFPVNVRLFDATSPEMLSISYSPAKIGATFLTNNDVVAAISFSEPVIRFETLKGGAKVSLEHTSVSISGRTGYAIFSQNEEFTLRFYDASGNSNETTLGVDYIDKQKPQVYLDVSYNDPKHDTATIEIKREAGEERELYTANNTFVYTVTRDGAYNYTISDKLGNMTVLTAAITGIDDARRIPDITAKVLNTDEITQGPVAVEFVSDMNVASLMFGEKVSLKKGIPYTVEVNSNGVYSFCFTTEFARVKEVKVEISNIDNKPPKLTVLGSLNLVYYVNDPDFDQSALENYTAIDERDGDLTESVAVDLGGLDIGKAGVYSIQYSVADRAGNTGSAARTVEVVEKGLFEITLDDGTGHVRKILTNGQRVIVNSNNIGVRIHPIDGVPVTAKIKAGLLNPAKMKAGTANIENESFTVQGSGWYTILVQDAWLRRQYFNVFVSAE